MIKKIIFFNIILLQIFVLFAKKDKKNSDDLSLINTKWVLTEISGMAVYKSMDTAFIVFHENYKFSGNFGCNLFFGEFTYTKKRIMIDFMGATKKFCFNMNLEEQFSKAIKNDITHYYIEKNNLFLLYRGQIICKFEGIIQPQQTE